MTEMFDPVAAWKAMAPEQQERFGAAAVAMMVGHVGRLIARDEADQVSFRGHETAYIEATNVLYGATIAQVLGGKSDTLPPRPRLACFGVRQCRACGCTDQCACEGGCRWVEENLCSRCTPGQADQAEDRPLLGPCCICGGSNAVRNIITLPLRATMPGRGWGCVVCELPSDGAVAVVCDTCLPAYRDDPAILRVACAGFPGVDGRVPISELSGPFDHDKAKHGADVA